MGHHLLLRQLVKDCAHAPAIQIRHPQGRFGSIYRGPGARLGAGAGGGLPGDGGGHHPVHPGGGQPGGPVTPVLPHLPV
ncbi:hypothetical protein SDC9_120582 [bioreactor metagenome]|uniref:Uncharacterized protein n=1 Tax=bioreactor metagenome TaxID=1076179 RepID=A0A645C785_9ZZZZ